jgi:hypothetical protein
MKAKFTEYYKLPENRQKHSEKIKEKYKTDPTYREKISIHQKKLVESKKHNSQNRTKETNEKIRRSLLKYYIDNETNTGLDSRSLRASKISARTIARIGRPVYQYDLNNNFIRSYNCIRQAGTKNGLNYKGIQAALLGYSKTSNGFIWRYANKFDTLNGFFNK